MRVRTSLFPPNALRASARIATATVTLAFLVACATDKSGPTELSTKVDAASADARAPEGLLSPVWQEKARYLASHNEIKDLPAPFSPTTAGHAYPFLGVAQYLAVQRAEAAIRGKGRVRTEADRGAVAGASAVVLTYLFPTKAQMLEGMVTAQANAGTGHPHPAFSAGLRIGRAVGAQIVTRAIHDGFDAANTAAPDVVLAGTWVTSLPVPPNLPYPVAGQLPGVRPWFLTSAQQFRPAGPPGFGSDAFNIARDELVQITALNNPHAAEQKVIAIRWALNAGTPTASGFWLGFASDQIAAHGLSEREATHVFALVSATMADATIGCWDAKQTYWLIRPWKASKDINTYLEVGRPNHPSYPSGHSCVSASGAAVIASFFPELTSQLNAMVVEAGMSRMYAGIHYRFDCETGQILGRSVAAFTIAADRSGNSVLTPNDGDDGEHEGGGGQH
jgi:membrane-associated phospholipid phosphatase